MFSRPRYERGARDQIPIARRRVGFRDLSPASQQLLIGLLHLQQILAALTLPREAGLAKDQTSASGSTEESCRNPERSEDSQAATIKTKIPETRTSSSHSEDGHPEGRQMCQSSDLWRNLEAETTCAQTPASENQHRSAANQDSSVQVEIYKRAIVGQATRTAVDELLDDVQADELRIDPPSSVATETEIEDELVTCSNTRSSSAETVGSTCKDEDEGVQYKSSTAIEPKADTPTCKDEEEDVTCSNTGSSASAARLPETEELSCEDEDEGVTCSNTGSSASAARLPETEDLSCEDEGVTCSNTGSSASAAILPETEDLSCADEGVTCSNTRSSTSWFLPDLVMGVVALPDLLVDICRQGSPAD